MMENDTEAMIKTAQKIRLKQTLHEAAQIYRRLGDFEQEQVLLNLAAQINSKTK